MTDLIFALFCTALSSSAGVAVTTLFPPPPTWLDLRLLAPLLPALVNGGWLLFREWKRSRTRSQKQADQLAQWTRQEADYVLEIQRLKQAAAEVRVELERQRRDERRWPRELEE